MQGWAVLHHFQKTTVQEDDRGAFWESWVRFEQKVRDASNSSTLQIFPPAWPLLKKHTCLIFVTCGAGVKNPERTQKGLYWARFTVFCRKFTHFYEKNVQASKCVGVKNYKIVLDDSRSNFYSHWMNCQVHMGHFAKCTFRASVKCQSSNWSHCCSCSYITPF